ncbi:hypothetical protein POM88_002511 [Heracleum sosnowskyi]|uniref:F-box domain-containing protein n=1 Tax=Heracleum sosnowskyi TaxID=360622 RepID=A0AAD8JFU1_9APIA|nr:hypothetical protein POM88_002511 [Heracleum sosnowskyi]
MLSTKKKKICEDNEEDRFSQLPEDLIHKILSFLEAKEALVNLNISTTFCETHGFVVLAPKLSNFSSSGIFPIRFGVCELQKVDIKLQDWAGVGGEQYYPPFISMLLGLGNYANNLTFDSKSIEALSKISYLLVGLPSPFYKLTNVKLPRGYKESSIPEALRNYLLGGSPKASIVT